MPSKIEFTSSENPPVGNPPRQPFIWYARSNESYYLAKNNSWLQISIDASHPARTDNPHSVTAYQVGNYIAQWNASQIRGRNISTGTPANRDTLVHNSANQWVYTPIGMAALKSYSSSRKYISDCFSLTLGEFNPVYDLSSDTMYFDVKISAKEAEQWNANQVGSIPIDLSAISNGSVLYYDGTSWIAQSLSTEINKKFQEYYCYLVDEMNTTAASTSSAALIPNATDPANYDSSTFTTNDLGLFDEFTNTGYVTMVFSGHIKYEICATIMNTTTADGTARIVLSVNDIDYDPSECIATSTNTTSRYQTVTRSGFIEVTEGDRIRLNFSNSVGASNNIRVKAGSATLYLTPRTL